MEYEHIPTDRAWALIRNGLQLAEQEAEHVRRCDGCQSSLAAFLQLGFSAQIQVHQYQGDANRAKSMSLEILSDDFITGW